MSAFSEMLRNRANRHQLYSRPQFWDQKADERAGDAVSMWPNNHLNAHYHHELTAVLARLLPPMAGQDVLDLGCGTGRIARYLAARGAQVRGVDFSEKAIAIARRAGPDPENPCYEVASMFDLADEARYDLIVSWGSVTFACRDHAEWVELARRLRRALRPGGRMLLLEPVHRGFLHRVLALGLPDFCAVLREAGFQVGAVEHLHFWPARLALAFLPWPAWLTTVSYRFGQGLLRLLGRRLGGDYHAIPATAA